MILSQKQEPVTLKLFWISEKKNVQNVMLSNELGPGMLNR